MPGVALWFLLLAAAVSVVGPVDMRMESHSKSLEVARGVVFYNVVGAGVRCDGVYAFHHGRVYRLAYHVAFIPQFLQVTTRRASSALLFSPGPQYNNAEVEFTRRCWLSAAPRLVWT